MDTRDLDRVSLLKVSFRQDNNPTTLLIIIGIYREVPGAKIPGGSEDVMLDLAIRQLVKNFQRKTKVLETSMELLRASSKL